jgi:hypothetical protein
MTQTATITEAIEQLYRTFSRYPLPKYTDPCLNCHSIDEDVLLRSKPLREAELSDLRDYAVDALTDWGDVNVFKHFLPRVFELFASDPDPATSFIDPEIIFSKFRHGSWRTWPPEEQSAVENFLHAVWAKVLNDPPPIGDYTDLESWLCSIAQCEDDLTSYLLQWIEDDSLYSSLALSSFLISSNITGNSGKRRNAFWETREEQYSQLSSWVKSKAVSEKLLLAEGRWSDEGIAREFAIARDLSLS